MRNLLSRETDFDVVDAGTFDEVLEVVEAGCPDIAVIDLDLPPDGAVGAVRALADRCDVHAIVWSVDPTPETVVAAISAGASGYLRKEISAAGFVRALRGLGRGEAPLSRDLTSLMISAIHRLEDRDRTRDQLSVLSSREREILDYISRGARNRQIAEALTISEFTVKRHVQNILAKLELGSRHAAADFYRSAQSALVLTGVDA